jgi:predicted nuclease of predicted toxin-antitoxin system
MRPKVVIDTNILFAAVARSSNELPDCNSKFDRETRDSGRDPEKIRGGIISLLLEADLVVPTRVVKELEGLQRSDKLSETNKSNIDLLLNAIGDRHKKITPCRMDVIRQKGALIKIQTQAEEIASANKKAGLNIPSNWFEENLHKKTRFSEQGSPDHLKNLKEEPYCTTWSKIYQYLPKVEANIYNLPNEGETKEFELLKQKDSLEKEMEVYQDDNTEIYKKIAKLEIEAEKERPFLVADIEILLTAQKLKCSVATLDKDFQILKKEVGGCNSINLINISNGVNQTIKTLVDKIKENLNQRNEEETMPL